MKGFHKLRVTTEGDVRYLSGLINVYLDDVQIYPRSLQLDLEAGSVPRVFLDLDIRELEISADALVALQAYVKEKS